MHVRVKVRWSKAYQFNMSSRTEQTEISHCEIASFQTLCVCDSCSMSKPSTYPVPCYLFLSQEQHPLWKETYQVSK